MNVLTQPTQQGSHITTAHMILRRSDLSGHRLAQLGTDQVTQEVGGEVTEEPFTPVDIL